MEDILAKLGKGNCRLQWEFLNYTAKVYGQFPDVIYMVFESGFQIFENSDLCEFHKFCNSKGFNLTCESNDYNKLILAIITQDCTNLEVIRISDNKQFLIHSIDGARATIKDGDKCSFESLKHLKLADYYKIIHYEIPIIRTLLANTAKY